jgi:hypothetical protein
VNLLKNDFGTNQTEDLLLVLKRHPTLKSLCGNKGDETELDMSGKMWGADDAAMLAAEIVWKNRALTTVVVHKFPLPIERILRTKALETLDLSGKGLVDLDAVVLAALCNRPNVRLFSILVNVCGKIF